MRDFSQSLFNKEHAEPRDYGEGDWYVVGDQFTDEEAAELISKWETNLTGEPHYYVAEDICDFPMVIGRNEDGDEDWCLSIHAKVRDIVAWGKGISL